MAFRVEFMGHILAVREAQLKIQKVLRTVYCFDIFISENIAPPRNSPGPKEMKYMVTLVLNRKQYMTFETQVRNEGMEIIGCHVLVTRARILLRPTGPLKELSTGDFMLINYDISSIGVKRILEAKNSGEDVDSVIGEVKERNLQDVEISSIQVPDMFLEHEPNPSKIAYQEKYYKNHGHFNGIIVYYIHPETDQVLLTDGYAIYLAAKKLGLQKVQSLKERRASVLKMLDLVDNE